MLDDVVVDTNVFQHSADERQRMRVAARQFLIRLLAGKANLCIDEGFDLDESKNKSKIGCEYIANLRFVDSAFQILAALGAKGKIRRIKRTSEPGICKKIRILIHNKTDRTFIRVTYASRSQTFVSHDFEDFPAPTRSKLRLQLGVDSITSTEARHLV